MTGVRAPRRGGRESDEVLPWRLRCPRRAPGKYQEGALGHRGDRRQAPRRPRSTSDSPGVDVDAGLRRQELVRAGAEIAPHCTCIPGSRAAYGGSTCTETRTRAPRARRCAPSSRARPRGDLEFIAPGSRLQRRHGRRHPWSPPGRSPSAPGHTVVDDLHFNKSGDDYSNTLFGRCMDPCSCTRDIQPAQVRAPPAPPGSRSGWRCARTRHPER